MFNNSTQLIECLPLALAKVSSLEPNGRVATRILYPLHVFTLRTTLRGTYNER